jgi:hypothetical protein
MITLDLDHPIFDGAAAGARNSQFSCCLFDHRTGQMRCEVVNDNHAFAVAVRPFAAEQDAA